MIDFSHLWGVGRRHDEQTILHPARGECCHDELPFLGVTVLEPLTGVPSDKLKQLVATNLRTARMNANKLAGIRISLAERPRSEVAVQICGASGILRRAARREPVVMHTDRQDYSP